MQSLLLHGEHSAYELNLQNCVSMTNSLNHVRSLPRFSDEVQKLLEAGTDPWARRRRLDRIDAAAPPRDTFGDVVAERMEYLKASGRRSPTLSKNKWLLEDLAAPLACRPIAEISADEILQLLKQIETSGKWETARRLRGAIGTVFKHAMLTSRVKRDPTFLLHGALLPRSVHRREAITDEIRLGQLMVSIDEYVNWVIRAALQFLALTMARPGDIRMMRRSEINFEEALWRIPAERMITRRQHDVPLSRQALKVLKEVWPISECGEFVFPIIRSIRKPLAKNALNSALRRMGYARHEMTPFGFRTSASTILNARGFNSDVIEAALARQEANNEVRPAYNRATYWRERVELMQAWADLLDEFKMRSLQPHVETAATPIRRNFGRVSGCYT